MSTLRDEINEAIYRAEDGTYDVNDLTTEILALIRERLLSDEAVNDAAFAYHDWIDPVGKGTHAQLVRATEDYEPISAALTAAIDTVTGETA